MSWVLVDVDGTLLDSPSSETSFLFYLMRHGHLGPRQLTAAAFFFLYGVLRYGKHAAKKNKAYLYGMARDDVRTWAEHFVHEQLAQRLRPDVLRRLEAHRQRGDRIALLTGTPDFIAAPLAHLIGAERWSATSCATRGGRYCARALQSHPFADEKVSCAQELCASLGTTLEACVAYADAIYDLPLLERVGVPVAVYPDTKLTTIAAQRGWEILDGRACAPLQVDTPTLPQSHPPQASPAELSMPAHPTRR